MLIDVKTKVKRVVNGKIRKRNELYLVDRDFFSNAEFAVCSTLNEQQDSHIIEEYEIISLKWSNIREVASQYEGSYSYVATLVDTWVDEDGTEKNLKYKVLLWANDLTEANERVHELAREGYNMLIEGIKRVDYTYIDEEDNE